MASLVQLVGLAESHADDESASGDADESLTAHESSFGPADALTAHESSFGPADGYSKLGAKISCLACRAAKRKCLTSGTDAVCRRCSTQSLICEYQRHRRGRKKKHDKPAASALTAPSAAAPAQPPLTTEPCALQPRMELPTASTSAVTLDESAPLRHSIQFSHIVPTGDSSPYLPGQHSAPLLGPAGTHAPLLHGHCPDPVQAGILSELDAHELFDYYFRHLNLVVAILDPHLHTAATCRDRSRLLFTAVLTVTAKLLRPAAYNACSILGNKLVGQAVEFGFCSVEVVQALILLAHHKKPDDATSWRRVGYAIRMAQELRLNVRATRPLPPDKTEARWQLNQERCWLNLIIADYHLAIHHSLPRMIAEEGVNEPADWVLEHEHLPCAGESLLAPWITFSRICRLYSDMLNGMNGDPANMRSLRWLEQRWKRWKEKWLDKQPLSFVPPQQSTLRLFSAYFAFHLAEYKLLFASRHAQRPGTPEDRYFDFEESSDLSLAFAECVDTSLALAAVFQRDFVRPGFVPFCVNLTWVALAVVTVWLVKNMGAMPQSDRDCVIRALQDIQSSTKEASVTPDDMSGYMHRLVTHLLGSISPAWHLTGLAAPTPVPASPLPRPTQPAPQPHSAHLAQYQHPNAVLSATSDGSVGWPFVSSQQLIQEGLYANPPPPLLGQVLMNGQTIDPDASIAVPCSGPPHALPTQDDALFPTADDDIWRLLFPAADTAAFAV